MNSRFEFCVSFVLEQETEYTADGAAKCEHDKHDPGGTTKYGIDQRSHPHIDICALTRDEAEAIYYTNEWLKARCGELNAPWDLVVFDSAVNPGLGWCIPTLQRVVWTKADGWIGPQTVAAVNEAMSDQLDLFLTKREGYYRALPAEKNGKPFRDRFLCGWLNRVMALRKACLTSESGKQESRKLGKVA